jgi:hypothetical protein
LKSKKRALNANAKGSYFVGYSDDGYAVSLNNIYQSYKNIYENAYSLANNEK